MRHPLVAIAALLTALALPSPARAEHPPIVLESYLGERPEDAEKLLAPLLEELATSRFVAGHAGLGRNFETSASRLAVAGGLPSGFLTSLNQGYDLWANGQFVEATKVLGPLVETARENTGDFAKNQNRTLHDALQKALIALALSHLKQGDRSAARQAMMEALRGNENLKITPGMYGKVAAELYNEVFRDLTERGFGKLSVTVATAGAAIYVNERLVDVGAMGGPGRTSSVELTLYPGDYRVLARFGDELTRAHKITVLGGGVHKLVIDPAFDRVVRTGPSWAGFQFENEDHRDEQELDYSAKVAAAIDAESVIVVGIDTVRGRRMMRGTMVNKVSGEHHRGASISLDTHPSVEQRRNLARYLLGGPETPGIIVGRLASRRSSEPAVRGDDLDGPRPLWGGWKWVAGGAAVAAGLAGGVILSFHGKCSKDIDDGAPCPNNYDTAVQGWLTVGGAVALAGVTAYLFVKERRGGAARTAYIVPTDGGAMAGYAARF